MARALKHWIRSYLDYTRHSESPDKFHFWTAVSTIAGALRRKVWLDMGYFQWTPNFFIFLVAPPGIVSKSTSVSIGMDILAKVDGIHFGPSSVTWQKLAVRFANCLESYPLNGDLLGPKLDMCCMTVAASELGTFFDPDNREAVDFLVDLWDGKNPRAPIRDTKTDGEVHVPNPWFNLIACTTPAWIADNVNNHFIGGGFASRTLFVFSETKRRLVAYPFKAFSWDHKKKEEELLSDLSHIASLCGAFQLTDDAVGWGEAWYADHYEKLRSVDEKFGGYISRKQTHIHKLAMVLSAAQRDDLIITAADLKAADQAVTDLELDMPRTFGQMNREQIAEFSADALEIIKARGSISREELFREHFLRRVSYETFSGMLDALMNSGLVGQDIAGGRMVLKINTELLERATKNVAGG